jgi:zinc protease
MKLTKRNLSAAALAMTALASAAPSFSQATSVKDIKVPALHVIQVQQPKRIQLANGMVIFLQEDHELPIIQGSAVVRGGDRDEPADKVGLSDLYAATWRTGGTKEKTGDELDELLSSRAASIEASGGESSHALSFRAMKNDFDFVFPIFTDLLRNPAFREEKLALAKNQANGGISRRNDDPNGIAQRETAKLVYGPDSPYARVAEYSTVAAVTREDLVKWHDRLVNPSNIILGVAGDFDAAAMEAKLRKAFEPWAKGTRLPTPANDLQPAKAGVYFVPRNDVTQSTVFMVHPGQMKNNPDYTTLAVMNELFGGGFSGRLLNHIRTEKGLAYSVGGGVTTGWDRPGQFLMTLGTKSGTTVEAISLLRAEVDDLQKKPVTAEELRSAKDILLNSFVFSMDSKKKVLDQRTMLEFFGYPADFYERYRQGIENVTAEDVSRVANKYIHPDQFAVMVVGKEKDFDKPLSTLGNVTTVDITIPEPGAAPKPVASGGAAAAAPAPPAASTPEGLALVHKVQDFVGGKAKLSAIKALRAQNSATMKTPQGEMTLESDMITEYPDKQHNVITMPMGQMTMVVTPDAGFVLTPMGPQDLPGSQRTSTLESMKGDVETVLINVDNPKYLFTVAGSEKIGDTNAAVLQINADGTQLKWYVDPATGRIIRKSQMAKAPRSGELVTEYADWKSFAGLNLPSKFTTTLNGEQVAAGEMKSLEVNPTIDPTIWSKPQK